MKIPSELTHEAYSIAKQVFEQEISFKEGRALLVRDNRMNANSASDFINNFRHMVNGERFTRTDNAYSTDYFLENIRKDYGLNTLAKALDALRQHFDYYEGVGKSKVIKKRLIWEKHNLHLIKKDTNYDEIQQNEIDRSIQSLKWSKVQIISRLKSLTATDSEYITLKSKVYKRDNYTIALIKKLRDYRCQICNTTILTKTGTNYIEAAHIKAKHESGPETPGNILILCPNHHKEFDYGDRHILKHTQEFVEFLLNTKTYTISLKVE
jgi:predicted restriction endonuclease